MKGPEKVLAARLQPWRKTKLPRKPGFPGRIVARRVADGHCMNLATEIIAALFPGRIVARKVADGH